MDVEEAAATVHVAAATSALVLGAVVVANAKGTRFHRWVGGAYVVALVVVNLAAFTVHREATFGIFHVLAVMSLTTVLVGITPMLMGRRSHQATAMHAYCMVWSYAGLVGAGVGQLAASTVSGGSATVLLAITSVLAVGGALIHWRVPTILASQFR